MQTRAHILGRQNHKQQVCNFNSACQTKQKGEFVTKEFKTTFLNKKSNEWIVLQANEVYTQKTPLVPISFTSAG